MSKRADEKAPLKSEATSKPSTSFNPLLILGAVILTGGVAYGVYVLARKLGESGCDPPQPEEVAAGCASFISDPNLTLWQHAAPPLTGTADVQSLDIVVAFCNAQLGWLTAFTHSAREGLGVAPTVHVYSKCGENPTAFGLVLEPGTYTVTNLPNTGRCDHTYAFHLADRTRRQTLADVTLFVKDTLNPDAPQERVWGTQIEGHFSPDLRVDEIRPLSEFYEFTLADGFACLYDAGFRPRGSSHWHEIEPIREYTIDDYSNGQAAGFLSPLRPLGAWLDNLTSEGDPVASRQAGALWPVCYGGNFGAARHAVIRQPSRFWHALELSLGRGPDSIEEGHYAERSWAGLMARKLTPPETRSLRATTAEVMSTAACPLCELQGQLLSECGTPAAC